MPTDGEKTGSAAATATAAPAATAGQLDGFADRDEARAFLSPGQRRPRKQAFQEIDQICESMISAEDLGDELGVGPGTVRHWKSDDAGREISGTVYFTVPEAVDIAMRSAARYRPPRFDKSKIRVLMKIRAAIRAAVVDERQCRVKVPARMRPDLIEEADRHAAKLGLDLGQYLELLVYSQSTKRFRETLNPELSFVSDPDRMTG